MPSSPFGFYNLGMMLLLFLLVLILSGVVEVGEWLYFWILGLGVGGCNHQSMDLKGCFVGSESDSVILQLPKSSVV